MTHSFRTIPPELSVDEVNGCRERRGSMPLPAAGQALEVGTLHQQIDVASADIDAATKPQLRVDATSAVSLASQRGPCGSRRSATRDGPTVAMVAGLAGRSSRRASPRACGRQS